MKKAATYAIATWVMGWPICHAAANSDAVTDATNAAALDEIVVTAQRRAENAMEVPVSVSAVSGADLAKMGINSADQMATLVPGLSYSNTGPIPVFGIRGVTLNDYGASNESPIALYVDDVYFASPSSASSQLFDVSRVEVLRGPQGTLFGRNATGGLVQIISNKPTQDFDAETSLQYGSYNQVIAQGAVGGPITDRLRVRAAFMYDRDDGWQYNEITHTRQAKTNEWAARLIADYDITDSLMSELNLHGGNQDNITPGYYNRGELNATTGAPCTTGQILSNACASPFGNRDPNPKPTQVYSDVADPRNRYHTSGADETLTLKLAHFDLTSITAFEYSNKYYEEDSDGSPDPLLASLGTAARTQYSEELRASGEADRAHWVVGAFAFYEKLTDGFDTLLQVVPYYGTYGNQNQFFSSTHSAAVFSQIDYQLLPAFTVTGGVRYSSETKHLTISDDFAAPTYVDHDEASTDRVTWRTALEWRFFTDWMAYGSVSTGFKSPAFDTSLVLQGGAIAARPETDTNYELGVKGVGLDRKLEVSAAAFYLEYKNFQIVTIPPNGNSATSELLNAPSANVYGIDAEIRLKPVAELSVGLSGTLLHTKIHAPDLFVGQYPLDGAELAYSPKESVKAQIAYDYRLPESGVLSPHAELVYNAASQSAPVLDPLETIPSYTVVNAGLRYAFPKSKTSLDFFVDNLTNKYYITYAGDFAGYDILQWAKPRTFAIRVSNRW